ncbi:pyruvate kinase [Peredibacter starrii]|uniref:Pyruvate kinase n=1 Tax=Peredibacter starrii TaxID=28202 RepID=A0AAX4HMZ8_9BACT|nr:pyruvate kinase [Peredibacter starrii]WPU64518.1 pyruvate kinase [Peredibacter starrii]
MSIRRAKIIATIGPSSNTIPMLEKMIKAGMNAARVNMSHGTYEAHEQSIKNIREASRNVGKEVAILLDLQGPKIRVDKLPEPLELKDDEVWVIGPSHVKDQYPEYSKNFIPTIYKNLVKDAHVGARILFDDGLLEAEAIEKDREVLKIKVKVGGILKSNKGINLPYVKVSAPSFTEKDREDLMFGLKQGVDYVALSFVRTAEDILEVKALLHSMKVQIPIVSKIEKPEALDNMESIVQVSDMIMIARGDMGVEVGNHLVPAIQKRMIKICNELGKPIITATQMLESMITNSRPTRAEASDVANAIWDGTDVVMLSGETASGKYPIEAIQIMGQIIEEAEKKPTERPLLRNMNITSVTATVQVSASIAAEKLHARWIISITEGGNSCLKMTRFRPKTHVLGVTNSLHVIRKMSLYWGISPYYFNIHENSDLTKLEELMIDKLKKENLLQIGDKVVVTVGDGKFFRQGTTNSVRVETIKDVPRALKNTDQDSIQEVSFDQGKLLLDTSICASCQACINVCPFEIWTASIEEHHETRINGLNVHKCTLDMACVEACPTGAIEIIPFNP